MANFYCFADLIGGGAGALDNLDGAGLSDKDAAFVVTNNIAYVYQLDADSGLDEDSPFVIAPDDNPGTKRWVLCEVYGGFDAFLELTDTPNSYDSADIGKVLRLKADLSGVEFYELVEHSHANKAEIDKVTDGDHDVIASGNPHSVTPTELSLVIGTDVQAHDDQLDDLSTTEATAAELNELTDGSETELHSHVGIGEIAFTDLTDVAEVSIGSDDIGKVVQVSSGLELEFAEAAGPDRPLVLTPESSCGPAANFATHDTIAGGSTPAEVVSVLDFDPDASEYCDFKFALPSGYNGGGLTVTVVFSMTSDHDEGTPHKVRWEIGFARINDDGIAISADHAYAFNGVSAIVPSVLTEVSYDNITFTDGADMDSLAAGEMAILRIYRDHDHADDNATGDAELQMIQIKET